jgi:hypothetical protein
MLAFIGQMQNLAITTRLSLARVLNAATAEYWMKPRTGSREICREAEAQEAEGLHALPHIFHPHLEWNEFKASNLFALVVSKEK